MIDERFTPPQEIRQRYDKAYEIVNESTVKNLFRGAVRIVRPGDQREASEGNLQTAIENGRRYSDKYLPALKDEAGAMARVAGKTINPL